ncbi:alpha/beta hydrolase [Nocardioides dongkuii]|uniref:alpha/beta hydrolase n=1 Tax=Nocardioides dongkuii TaxID=2760089 RepID=UPI0015F7E1EF|nr:alpha/beta hydrolase-fold protein [Nocardioides dongkuii]
MPHVSRRAVLVGGGVVTAGAAAVGAGVHQGVLPGRPWLQARLGLDGEDGVVPDVAPGRVRRGTFVSEARGGTSTGWAVVLPPGSARREELPVVVALHGRGQDHAALLGPGLGLDRFLAAHTAAGGTPYAVAVVDGGDSYWHPRPSGEDSGAMVVDELLPLLAGQGLRAGPTDRIGLLGWSMGGYGALRLAGLLGAGRVAGVVAVSPALWTDPDDASPSGFADAAEYEEFSVLGRQGDLEGVAVRVDCGTGDPFYRAAEEYVAGFPASAQVAGGFEPGGHTSGYWRRVLPAQLDFLGRTLDA